MALTNFLPAEQNVHESTVVEPDAELIFPVGQLASHPVLASLSSLNLFAKQVTAVHAVEDEQKVHVPSVTEGQPASHPSVASLLVLNLLAEQEAMVVQVDALEVAAEEHAVQDVAPATEGHPASHPLLA